MAAPATGTAISRRGLSGLALALTMLAWVGCGGGASTTTSSTSATAKLQFAWLRPAGPPRGWRSLRAADGATLSYPPGWQPLPGDPGTATAALRAAGGGFAGYLNATPRQGAETLAGWSSFRVRHNAAEGNRDVRLQAAASGLRFRSGRGACVRDAYATATGARFVELACLVLGPHAAAVIVGAAPPQRWAGVAPLLERAISAFSP